MQLQRRPLWIGIGLCAAGLAGAALWYAWPAPHPITQLAQLPEGVEAYYRSDSRLLPAAGYPRPRELRIDGDFFIRADAAPDPLVIRTRLLVLTITGESALRITAYAQQAGEQVEVLKGQVEARKSYPSPYMDPDQLGPGDMTMINRDIDLMEKETTDVARLRSWSEELISSVAAQVHARHGV